MKEFFVGAAILGSAIGSIALLAWIHPMVPVVLFAGCIFVGCSLAIGDLVLDWLKRST